MFITYKPSDWPAKQRLESTEQIEFCEWVRCHYPEYYDVMMHPPNETRASPQYQVKLNQMGRKKGAHDLIFFTSPIFTIEVKQVKKTARASGKQKVFAEIVAAIGGRSYLCYGAEQCKKAFLYEISLHV